jgi:type I restriction enzyme M protein
MDSCLLVRNNRKSKERIGKVLFIDAHNFIIDNKNNSYLSNEHQQKIFQAYLDFRDIDGFTTVISEEEILGNHGSLKITDYLKRSANIGEIIPFEEALKIWITNGNTLSKSLNELFKSL